jgi:hypothetical protein
MTTDTPANMRISTTSGVTGVGDGSYEGIR